MFGIGLMELLTILVLATVVLGPERMVDFARQLGRWMAKFRAETDSVTKEFREAFNLELGTDLDEVRSILPGRAGAPRWNLPTSTTPTAEPAQPVAGLPEPTPISTDTPVQESLPQPEPLDAPVPIPEVRVVDVSPDAEPVSIAVGQLVPEDAQAEATEIGEPLWVDAPVTMPENGETGDSSQTGAGSDKDADHSADSEGVA